MAERPLYTLFKNLKAQNFDVPDDYDKFESALTREGKAGADNRHAIYQSLKQQNFDVPDTYERFYTALFHPVSKDSSRANGGDVPMTAADRARFSAGARSISQSAGQTMRNAGRYNTLKQRRDRRKNDFGRVNIGTHKTPYGDADNIVKDDFAYNPETGKAGTYVTSDNEDAYTLPEAQQKQGALDEQNNAYQEAVDTGEIPSVFDVRDKNGNYDLQENIGKDGTYLTEEGADAQLKRKLDEAYARKKQIEAAIAEDNAKNGNPLLSYGASIGAGNGRDAASSDYRNKLATSLALVNEQIGSLEAVKQYPNSSVWQDAWKALDNTAFNAETWDFGLTDFAVMGQMERIKTKIDNKLPLTASEQTLLKSKLGADAAAALEDEKMGKAYRWTKIAGQSLPFMADFFMTGGYGGITRVVSKEALKYAAKKGMSKLGAAILKNTGVVAGDVIGSYAMAASTQALKTGADIMQRHLGTLYQDEDGSYKFGTFDDNGNLLHEGGETMGKALYKGLTSAMVENYTEKLFGHDYGIKKGALNFMEKHGMTRSAEFFKNLGTKDWYAGTKKWMAKFGINGFGEEVMEEEIGIPLHAILDGDNKISDLADLRQQMDIIGGMAISVGSMYALGAGMRPVKGVYNRAQYYRFKNKVNNADAAASSAFGNTEDAQQKWADLKNKIDNTPNEKMGDVMVDIIRSTGSMSKAQINAAVHYGVNLMKMRGYNLASTMQMNAKAMTGEQNTPEDQHQEKIDNAYSEGHEAEGSATHDIQQEYQLRLRNIAKMFGISEEQARSLDDTALDGMTGESDAKDMAIYQWQAAKARYQGVMDNVRNKVDTAAQEAATRADMITDKSRGTVRNAMMKGNNQEEDFPVYILGGNVSTHDDGAIDVSGSDKMIFYYDPSTGKVESCDPTRFASIGEEVNASDAKAMAVQMAREKAIREQTRDVDGRVEVGSQFTVMDQDGTQHDYEVLADNGDGTVTISIDGNVQQGNYPSLVDLQQLRDQSDGLRLTAKEAENVQNQVEGQAKAQVDQMPFDQMIDDGGKITPAIIAGEEDKMNFVTGRIGDSRLRITTLSQNKDGSYKVTNRVKKADAVQFGESMSVDDYKQMVGNEVQQEQSQNLDNNSSKLEADRGNTTEEETRTRETEAPAEEEATPTDEKPAEAPAENQNEKPAEAETAPAITLSDGTEVKMKEDGNPDLSQLTPAQVAELYDTTFEDDADQIISDRVSSTKKALDKAENMKVTGKNFTEQKANADAKKKAIAEAQAEYDAAKAVKDAYDERMWNKRADTPEGRRDLIDKAKAKYQRLNGKAENVTALWNDTVGKVLHRLYDGLGVNVFDHEPQTIEEYVSSNIAPYSLNYEGNENSKGVKQETGLERKDFAKSRVLAAEGKGQTVDEFVHKLWDNRPKQFENVSDQEIRNALLDLIMSDMNAYDMNHLIENTRIAQAEREIEDEKNEAENTRLSNETDEKSNDLSNESNESNEVPTEEQTPEDATEDKPLGEQINDVPFSARNDAQWQAQSERAESIEKNRVKDMQVVDDVVGKKTRRAFERIAKMMGATINWQYTDKMGNGWYDETTDADGDVHRTIYLTLDSSVTEGAQFIFGHEMTHEMKSVNPTSYEEFKNIIKNAYDKDFDKVVDKMEKRYSEAGIAGRDRSYYEEEVIADGIGELMRDLNLAHGIAMKMSHPLLAAIHDILMKIRRAFTGTEFVPAVEQVIRNIEQAYVATAKGTFASSSSGARFSLKDEEKAQRIEKLRESKPIEITGNEVTPSEDLKQYKKNALEYGKSLRSSYMNKDTGASIQLGKTGVKEVLNHDYKNVEQLQSVAAIPQIIENAIYIGSEENTDTEKNKDVSRYHYYVCGLKIGNKDYTVRAVVAEQPNGNRYYDHKLSNIEKNKFLDSLFGTTPEFNQGTQNDSGFDATSSTELTTANNSVGKDKKLISILQTNSQENGEKVKYSLRTKPEPKKKGIGYKVFLLGKDGKLYPPMVANPNGNATPVGVWLDADAAPIAGESKTGRPQVKQGGKGTQGGSGTLAYRPGWHLGEIPYALQFNKGEKVPNPLGIKNKKGEVIKVGKYFPKNFVFAEVEYADDVDYQDEANKEGYNENGKFVHSLAGLKHLPTDGSYKYRTNANPATDPWVITGAMKVNRILTRAEQADLVKKAGREPQQIQEGDIVSDEIVNRINQEIANAPKFSLKVYHGSGADFTEFDFDHMSEGAGSQYFGWGGYVSSSKKIGKDYAMLAKGNNKGLDFDIKGNVSFGAEDMLRHYIYKNQDITKGLDNAREDLKKTMATYPDDEIDEDIKELSKILAKKNDDIVEIKNPSYLYEVNIPDDKGGNYLDWYAPVSEEIKQKVKDMFKDGYPQSIKATQQYKDALQEYLDEGETEERFEQDMLTEFTEGIDSAEIFGDFYNTLGNNISDKGASELFSSLGYTGIKYPAGTISGGTEEGDTNYVIFKPEDMKIAEHTKFSLKSKPVRFEVGKSLSEDEKKEVLSTLKDAYKVNGVPFHIEETANGKEKRVYEPTADDYVMSDITNRPLRYYITLPDGRVAHPTEVYPNISDHEVKSSAAKQGLADIEAEEMASKAISKIYDAKVDAKKALDILNAMQELQHDTRDVGYGMNNAQSYNYKTGIFTSDSAQAIDYVVRRMRRKEEVGDDVVKAVKKAVADNFGMVDNLIDGLSETKVGAADTTDTKYSLKTDNQGNPLSADGTLKLDKIKSVDDLTDDDFLHPSRNIQMTTLSKRVADAIGVADKPVIIKKNIFERNYMRHKDVTPEQSKAIFNFALYNPDLYGQNQKAKRPYNWVLINTKDEEGKNRTVLLEVNPNKDNVEIVHWYFVNNKNLELIKKQAIREGDQILILPSEQSEEVGGLSNLTDGLSGAKIDNSSETTKENGEKFSLRLKNAIDETDTNPSDVQKESGNYKKGHVKFGGYDFTIENPKGSTRSGKDADGKEWKVSMHDTYGYIRGKFGKDGDHLDMFINDDADLDNWHGNVYVVDQKNADGSFDEHKVMYGFDSEEDAKKAYLSNYSKGWKGLGSITGVSKEDFDKWVDSSKRKMKPFADHSIAQNAVKAPETFEEFLVHPALKFSIRNEAERKAAENAYNFAMENRPDESKQYAIVDMSHEGRMPEYFEKKALAKSWSEYYNKVVTNDWGREVAEPYGNYKLFDLDKPFQDQVNKVEGKVPDKYEAVGKRNPNADNESGATYRNRYEQGEPSSVTYKDRYEAFKKAVAETSARFSLKGDKTLAGVHNITEDKLRRALKLGGLANPSLAVIDTDKASHNNFGEISLIAPSALVDKRTGKTAGTWTTDAYTQRYPSVERQMTDKGYEKFKKWVDGLEYSSADKSEILRQTKAVLEDNGVPAWELMYLKEKGIDLKAYDSDVDYRWQEIIENHPTAKEILDAMKSDPELNDKVTKLAKSAIVMPTWSDISKQVRKQIYEDTGAKVAPINPKVRAQVKEIFERDYAPQLLNKDGSPRKADVKKVVEDMVKQYDDTKKYSFYKSKVKASSYVNSNGLYPDYIRWQENKLDEFGTKNRIFRGYKNDGTRKYVPETLENVSKAMREDANEQTNGGEYTSFGSFIAKLADRVDSTEEMRANKDKLASNEDKEAFYNKWEEVYYELAKSLYNDLMYGEQRLHDIVVQPDPKKYAKKEYGITLTASFVKKLNALKDAVQNELKSGYFETKFDRPVRLNEFVAAVVPNNLGDDVRKGLEKAGLSLYEYNPNEESGRQRAFDEAANSSDGIKFSLRKQNNVKDSRIIPTDVDKSVSSQIEKNYDSAIKETYKYVSEKDIARLQSDVEHNLRDFSKMRREDIVNDINRKTYDFRERERSGATPNERGFVGYKYAQYKAAEAAAKRELEYRDARAKHLAETYGLQGGRKASLDSLEKAFNGLLEAERGGKESLRGLFEKGCTILKKVGSEVYGVENAPHEGAMGVAYADRTIALFIDSLTRTGTPQSEVAHTILHEMLHQATVGSINLVEKGKAEGVLTPKQIDAVNTIIDTYNKAKSDGRIVWEEGNWQNYGGSDVYEFAADMASTEQRKALSISLGERIMNAANELRAVGDVSLWQAIKNAIKSLFEVSDKSKMDKALNDIMDDFNETIDDLGLEGFDKSGYARYSLRRSDYEKALSKWKKENNLPKDAKRPVMPQQKQGESQFDYMLRVNKYLVENALWKTAPRYEGHLMTGPSAQAQFNRELQRRSVLTRIAVQDAMLAIRKAQEAIAKEAGIDHIGIGEDAYTAENRSHGKAKNEFEEYNQVFLEPLRKSYHKLMLALDHSYDNVKVYMIAKHGLERNRVMAFRDALANDYEENAAALTQYYNYMVDVDKLQNDVDFETGKIDYVTWWQNDDSIRVKYAPSYLDKRYNQQTGRPNDYAGLSSLFDGDDYEAKAYNMVHDVETAFPAETAELWKNTNLATKRVLRNSLDAGMMTKETFDYVNSMFQNYIPLRGWNDTTADDVWDYVGGGKGAFNEALKSAKGRTSLADDPIAYIENMAESGILINNRNWVKQHLLLLAENHPENTLLTLSKAWYVKTKDSEGNDVWMPSSPNIPASMTDPAKIKDAIKKWLDTMERLRTNGEAKQQREGLNIVYPQTNYEERQHEVRVMRNGEEYVIYVNGDPQLAQAINNSRARRVRETQDSMFEKFAAKTGRAMAAVYTSMSPLFVPANFFRDLTMTMASTAIREDARYNILLRKNFLTTWDTFKLVKEYQNGSLREKVANGSANADEKMFYDYMMKGGETGFISTMDINDFKEKIHRELKDLDRRKVNPKKAFHAIMEGIEYLNRVAEGSNRFLIYKTSIQYGRSVEEAINNAKDVTLNFNRKGTGEESWQTFRNLYLFVNPAVQSLQTLGALAKHHPIKFTAVTTAWMMSGMLAPMLNQLLLEALGGDDDKDKYWSFSRYDRRNNFIMWVPGTKMFLKVPISQEFRPFYSVGDMIASKMSGNDNVEETWKEYAVELLGEVAGLSPIDPTSYDGDNWWLNVMPNFARPILELAANVDFTGKPLFNDSDYNKYDPNWTKAYAGTPDWLVRISRMVNSIQNDYPDEQQNFIDSAGSAKFNLNNPAVVHHLLSGYLGGAYTLGSQVIGAITKALNDPKDFKTADVPFFSKFVSNPDDRPLSKKKGEEFWHVKDEQDRVANTIRNLKKNATASGDFSQMEKFFGTDEYKEYKANLPKMKKYDEERKLEKLKETGDEDTYKPHKITADDIYNAHATASDDFEDLKMKLLWKKAKALMDKRDVLGEFSSQGDEFYNEHKAMIDAAKNVDWLRGRISENKKMFLSPDGKDAFDAKLMKEIRGWRKEVIQQLESADKAERKEAEDQ